MKMTDNREVIYVWIDYNDLILCTMHVSYKETYGRLGFIAHDSLEDCLKHREQILQERLEAIKVQLNSPPRTYYDEDHD